MRATPAFVFCALVACLAAVAANGAPTGRNTAAAAQPAEAATPPYYRFWHGKRLTTLTLDEFSAAIHKFVIATTVVGEGIALDTYIPVLTPSPGADATWSESALVAYSSEEAYHTLMSSPRGLRYQHSHWNLFNKTCSSSRVPTPYFPSAYVEIDHAADVLNGTTLWYEPGTAAYHVVHNRTAGVSDEQYETSVNLYVRMLASVAAAPPLGQGMGLVSWLVRLDEDAVFEYQLWDGAGKREAALASMGGVMALKELHQVAAEFAAIAAPQGAMTTPITYGQGLSVNLPALPA